MDLDMEQEDNSEGEGFDSDSLMTPVHEHKFEGDRSVIEVTHLCCWSVSSCKGKHGVMNMIDGNLDTYWQSEAKTAHNINMEFNRKTKLSYLLMYIDYRQDESYTPNKVAIKIGNNYNDLEQLEVIKLTKPMGWMNIQLHDAEGEPISTYLLQLSVLANRQNGQNSHIRQLKLLSPAEGNTTTSSGISGNHSKFSLGSNLRF